MNNEETNDNVNTEAKPLLTAAGSTEFFHSGCKDKDIVMLLDMAIDLVEIWNAENSPYNKRLKRCWMKRAKELGATLSW